MKHHKKSSSESFIHTMKVDGEQNVMIQKEQNSIITVVLMTQALHHEVMQSLCVRNRQFKSLFTENLACQTWSPFTFII